MLVEAPPKPQPVDIVGKTVCGIAAVIRLLAWAAFGFIGAIAGLFLGGSALYVMGALLGYPTGGILAALFARAVGKARGDRKLRGTWALLGAGIPLLAWLLAVMAVSV